MGSLGTCLFWTLAACFILLQNAALRVTMRESSVEVVQGDYVVLPCSFFTMNSLSRLNIVWTMAPLSDPESPSQVIVYDHGQVIEDASLTGRVGFASVPWTADLVLNNTRISDAGIYRCMVNNPPETGDSAIGEVALSVLAPPALPVCQWDGDMDFGGSVTLSCTVTEGIPTPELHWDKIDPEEVSLDVDMDGDMSGSVQIVNVSSQTSGLYRCSVANLLGTQNCYVSLVVYTPPESSPGIMQGSLLTLAMALVLLALLVLGLWLHRSGLERRWREGKEAEEEEEEDCYNEIRYTPSLVKRSFV